tara:strand:+ start:1301 stop:1576 length:276 start_codon:yes stop_codon:yes gene_type:complete
MFNVLRKFIREEIGRNFHTKDNTPYTFSDLDDYNVEINTDGRSGNFFLDIFYNDEKIVATSSHGSHEEAVHASRMVIDNDRVKRMNHAEKK